MDRGNGSFEQKARVRAHVRSMLLKLKAHRHRHDGEQNRAGSTQKRLKGEGKEHGS